MRLLEMSEITGTQRTAKMKAKITFFEHTVLEVHIIISYIISTIVRYHKIKRKK